jgi:hypothetical protein
MVVLQIVSKSSVPVQFNGQIALQVPSQSFVWVTDLEALYEKMENPIRNVN